MSFFIKKSLANDDADNPTKAQANSKISEQFLCSTLSIMRVKQGKQDDDEH